MKRLLDDLNIFCAVVEHGSMKQTATALNIPHSTVSRRIEALEKNMGVHLLHRSTREITVTHRGQQLYNECAEMLHALDRSVQGTISDDSQFKGAVKISMPLRAGLDFLGAWLVDFANERPQLNLELSMTNDNVNLVHEQIDLAFRLGPLADSAATAVRLWDIPYNLYATQDFVKTHHIDKKLTAEQLTALPCVVSLPARSWRFVDKNHKAVMVRPPNPLIVDDLSIALYAVKQHNRVGLLPDVMCQAPDLVTLSLIDAKPLTRTMFAYQMGNRHTMKAARAIVEYVKVRYQGGV